MLMSKMTSICDWFGSNYERKLRGGENDVDQEEMRFDLADIFKSKIVILREKLFRTLIDSDSSFENSDTSLFSFRIILYWIQDFLDIYGKRRVVSSTTIHALTICSEYDFVSFEIERSGSSEVAYGKSIVFLYAFCFCPKAQRKFGESQARDSNKNKRPSGRQTRFLKILKTRALFQSSNSCRYEVLFIRGGSDVEGVLFCSVVSGTRNVTREEGDASLSFIPYWNFSMIDNEEARDNFLKDVCTFLRKFSRIPFGVTPKVILIAWERFGEIKDALTDKQYRQEDIQELMSKLLEDVQNIRKELVNYINCPKFIGIAYSLYDNDDDGVILLYMHSLKQSHPTTNSRSPITPLSIGARAFSTIPKQKSDER
ncbi:hypothetical protein Tco_0662786 [Tanacetum coccineum]